MHNEVRWVAIAIIGMMMCLSTCEAITEVEKEKTKQIELQLERKPYER